MPIWLRWFGGATLVAIVISACDRSSPTCPSHAMTVAEFPLDVGHHWTYFVVDEQSGNTDTLDLAIVASYVDSIGKRQTIWQGTIRNEVFVPETLFVAVLGDSIWLSRTIPGSEQLEFRMHFMFPLIPGKIWRTSRPWGGPDSCAVHGLEVITTASGVLSTYRVESLYKGGALSFGYLKKTWIARGVGLVRLEYMFAGNAMPLKTMWTWDLIAYEFDEDDG